MVTTRAVERDARALDRLLDEIEGLPPKRIMLRAGLNEKWVVEADGVFFYVQHKIGKYTVSTNAATLWIEPSEKPSQISVEGKQVEVERDGLVTLRVTQLA